MPTNRTVWLPKRDAVEIEPHEGRQAFHAVQPLWSSYKIDLTGFWATICNFKCAKDLLRNATRIPGLWRGPVAVRPSLYLEAVIASAK